MPIATPANESSILPTLSAPQQQRYLKVKDGANRVSQKHPDMNTHIYTDYLSDYLTHAANHRVAIQTENGAPLDPRYISDQVITAEKKLATEFDKKYPEFPASNNPAEVARAEERNTAFRRLYDEVEGNLLGNATKAFYNEDRGGVQWSSIIGGAIGLGLGALLGNTLAVGAGELGAGWMGMVATVILGGSGMILGSKILDKVFNPPQAPAATPSLSVTAPAQAKAAEPQVDTPTPDMENAKKQANEAPKATTEVTPNGSATHADPLPMQQAPARPVENPSKTAPAPKGM